jgi:hypothetical protein
MSCKQRTDIVARVQTECRSGYFGYRGSSQAMDGSHPFRSPSSSAWPNKSIASGLCNRTKIAFVPVHITRSFARVVAVDDICLETKRGQVSCCQDSSRRQLDRWNSRFRSTQEMVGQHRSRSADKEKSLAYASRADASAQRLFRASL